MLVTKLPQLPDPTPVVKLSALGLGLKPQQPARVVVVVAGAVVVVVTVVVVVVATGAVVVVVATGRVVVVVATGAVVVVVATGAVVVVVAAGAVVVVVATGAVVVVAAAGAVVVVVACTVVVVVPPAHEPSAHASQQLGTDPTHAVPPRGALHSFPACLIEQLVLPLESVWQQVTELGLPQVDCAAHCITAPLH